MHHFLLTRGWKQVVIGHFLYCAICPSKIDSEHVYRFFVDEDAELFEQA